MGVTVLVAVAATLAGCTGDHGQRREVASTDCYTCHVPEYDATTAPPHADLFSTQCADCHVTDHWVPAEPINHEWFVLELRHLDPRCTECHTVGFRAGQTPNTCYGCHQPAYEATTMPTHDGYPTDCASCHTAAGWVPSTFVHRWALTGVHARTPCSSCHAGDPPVYAGTPTTCVGCHRADYDASPYPGHRTFQTTCADCHTTDGWAPALEGAHPDDGFRITSGPHMGYGCTDCHNPSLGPSAAGMNTDCVGCHEGTHTRSRMDRAHDEEAGYPTGAAPPNFCLECHPDGRTP